jgi:hypothetical protein
MANNANHVIFYGYTGTSTAVLILILNERHLHHVMKEYVAFYNAPRPHQGINQRTPMPMIRPNRTGSVARRDVLGGIVNDYCRLAA